MKTVIHFITDKEVKENAQEVARALGLTLSDVINAALRNLIRERTVIFSDIPKMSSKLEKRLESMEEDLKLNRNLSPRFKTAQEFIRSLKS